jgi:acyl-CoA-dependent ceramide synthase
VLSFRVLHCPASAFKVLLLPIVLYLNWELVSPYVEPGIQNPFASLFLLSGRVSSSPPDNPLYAKCYQDLLFIAYYIVFFSLVRQLVTVKACRPIARYFGLKREAKLDRFGEQGYALVYFMVFGAWGFVSVPLGFLISFVETFLAAHHVSVAHVVVSYRVFLDRSVQF